MGKFIESIQRSLLEFTGLTYTDSEWNEMQNKNRATEENSFSIDSPAEERNFMRDSALQYYLMKNAQDLKFQQTFHNSDKTIQIIILSKLQSGSLDQKVLNDPAAVGFLYFLQFGKSSNKPMYISVPDLAFKLQSNQWIEETGAIEGLV